MESHGIEVSAAHGNNFEIFWRSLTLVGVAELFDKTWFMGLVFALRYGAKLVFVGSFMALFLHCFLAAALGLAFARFLPKVALAYLTAGLFFTFSLLYAKDWYQADPESDALEAGKEEAEEACADEKEKAGTDNSNCVGDASDDDNKETEACVIKPETLGTPTKDKPPKLKSEKAKPAERQAPEKWTVLARSFCGVFIAEWGDRTQIAMISQHSSQPLIPVFLGSALAFFLLTLSAVGAATLLNGRKLRERVVFAFSAVCFGIFGVLALKDAIAMSFGGGE